MKLGEVRGAIRKCKGNPVVLLPLGGATMKLTVQKTLLLEELERLCPGGKNVDTPFSFDLETGILSSPVWQVARQAPTLNEGDRFLATPQQGGYQIDLNEGALVDAPDALDLDDDDLLV